jgi:hypothetical protein
MTKDRNHENTKDENPKKDRKNNEPRKAGRTDLVLVLPFVFSSFVFS